MSPVDARNDTEKISSACLRKDDTAQINSCDTAQTVAQEVFRRKGWRHPERYRNL